MGRDSLKNTLIVGFALFAMFFGAGNLIFPPTLGLESGDQWPLSFIGFLTMDAVLACVGIFAVNAAGGPARAIESALGRRGGVVLNTAAIVCLCVVFAMPRTAATTFEITVAPYFGGFDPAGASHVEAAANAGVFGIQAHDVLLPFSFMFFLVVFLLSVRESRVVDIIGKFFTPTLVIGVLVLVVAGIVQPLGTPAVPRVAHVFQEGVRSGYQTMDVLGVVAFSLVLLDSPLVAAQPNTKARLSLLWRAGVIATVLLGLVYGGLAYLGATAAAFGDGMTQVQLLVALTQALLGKTGLVILGVVVLLACVTTAVALVSSAAAYFHGLSGGRVSYRLLLGIDCAVGILICNVGLQGIIQIADPVLGVVYPPFLTVVCLLLVHRAIPSRRVYQGAALGAALAALVLELPLAPLQGAIMGLPLAEVGFAWLPFAVAGGAAGWLAHRVHAV